LNGPTFTVISLYLSNYITDHKRLGSESSDIPGRLRSSDIKSDGGQ